MDNQTQMRSAACAACSVPSTPRPSPILGRLRRFCWLMTFQWVAVTYIVDAFGGFNVKPISMLEFFFGGLIFWVYFAALMNWIWTGGRLAE